MYLSLHEKSKLNVYDHCCNGGLYAETFNCWTSTPTQLVNTWYDQSLLILYKIILIPIILMRLTGTNEVLFSASALCIIFFALLLCCKYYSNILYM